jgi:heat shock protein HslJ
MIKVAYSLGIIRPTAKSHLYARLTMKHGILISFICSFLLAACAATTESQSHVSLAGTSWQLHAFQSMDDSQGTTVVDEPVKYTMTLNSDGNAAFRLDCNRGMGGWDSTPSASGDGGSLRFGPIAVTRALCPQPDLGEKLARDLDYVRSYRIVQGKLYMALMADAGIYEWHAQ